MPTLRLTEYQTAPGVALSPVERDALRSVVNVQPSLHREGRFDLTPGSMIGTMEVGDLAVQIRPKLPIDRVMFLISYAMDPVDWRDSGFDFDEQESLVEAIVPGFVRQVGQALRRGLLQGYRTEENALTTVRGRLRIEDQIRRHHGIAPPVEVRYDEFTEDIEVNRLIKAAFRRLRRMRIRSPASRARLRTFDTALAAVSTVEYDQRRLPQITWTRLNAHYRPAVRLAQLILRFTSFELRHGATRSNAFLVDMNTVFEEFVVTALRDALGVDPRIFRHGDATLRLDQARAVRLQPDISWWAAGRCTFVGDVKYKKVAAAGIKHPDLYQLLAYVVAADLPSGLLIYAAGEAEESAHVVVHLGRRLDVVTLVLKGSPADILQQIGDIAGRIRSMQRRAAGEVVAA